MASGIFAILDDISVLMDDVAAMSKLATRKTAGILGDDLAVNAEKATGFVSSRELPVLWAITRGSFFNKLIILPLIFLLNHFFPKAVVVILLIGGLYLAYEGAEKIVHFFSGLFNKNSEEPLQNPLPLTDEKGKINSAIRTDFILSLEIIIIALSTVMDKTLWVQVGVVTVVSIIATIGVYGLVALLVRMDDTGFLLKNSFRKGHLLHSFGDVLISLLPKVIKSLAVVGTVALLLVSGGIFIHNLHVIHDFMPELPAIFNELMVGFIIGCLVLIIVKILQKLLQSSTFSKIPE